MNNKETEAVVFVVDDDPSVRRSLRRLLGSAGHSVQLYASAHEFLHQKRDDRPACLILDVRMPGLDGLKLQEALAKKDGSIPIIFISGYGDISTSVQAMKGGAMDFLPKPFSESALLNAVEEALDRFRRESAARKEIVEAKQRLARLTPRETEVLTRVVAGRLNKQIAFELGISEKTVKAHRGRVMRKLEVGSVAALVRLTEKGNPPSPPSERWPQKAKETTRARI